MISYTVTQPYLLSVFSLINHSMDLALVILSRAVDTETLRAVGTLVPPPFQMDRLDMNPLIIPAREEPVAEETGKSL